MVDENPVRARLGPFGDPNDQLRLLGQGQVAVFQPIRRTLKGDTGTREQGRREVLMVPGVCETPAGRWVVERETETQFAGRGEGRRHAEQVAQAAGQPVGAPVAAQQRHDRAAVLGDGQHRRLAGLVADQRRQRADQDPGGADADDRPPGPEQGLKVRRGVRKDHLRTLDTAAETVQLGARQPLGDALRKGEPGGAEGDEGGGIVHDQASPLLCSRTMEKYGTSAETTESSGRTRWRSMVARSM